MKKLFCISSLLLLSTVLFAQRNYLYVSWDINTPTSNTNWISSTSSQGIQLGYRVFIEDKNLSFGIDFNRTTYDQYEPRQTFQVTNGAFTTDYFKYIYSMGLVASGQYYFKMGSGDRFYPYVGLGLGANNNTYMTYYNIYKESDTRWGFVTRPEAGIIALIGKSVGAMAAVHYDYSTNKSDYFNYKNFSTLGFRLGIVFMQRY